MTRFPKVAPWQTATVVSIGDETPRVKTIRLALPDWPGHVPGHHADVRLTAPDGYRAERSYSIASPPGASTVDVTVERLTEGEVSSFLTGELRPGGIIQLRGPIGRHFVWPSSTPHTPSLMVGGGTGIVPLMCMLRHRRLVGPTTAAALLYSPHTRQDVIFHDELADMTAADPSLTVLLTLTRVVEPGWAGQSGRINLAMIRELLDDLGGRVDCFVCGSADFVEAASALLLEAGQPASAIRTERFGPTGL